MKISIKIFIEHILVFFMILNTASVYERAYIDFYVSELALLFELLLFFFLAFNHRLKVKHLKALVVNMGPYLIIAFVYYLINVSDAQRIGYIMRFLVFIPIMILILQMLNENIQKSSILKAYVNVMFFLAVTSLIFWMFGTVLGIFRPTSQLLVNWGGDQIYKGYLGIYYEFQSTVFLGVRVIRNCSLFCEAPMFQFCLIFAISSLCFSNIRNKFSIKERTKIIVLSLAVITSFSTTGMACLFLIYGLNYYARASFSRGIKVKKMVTIIALLIGFIVAMYLFQDKSNSISWTIRTRSWIAYWNVFLSNPILGAGYLNDTVANDYSKMLFGQQAGTSNSLASILGQGGIFFSALYLIPLIGGILTAFKRKEMEIGFCIIVFFIDFMFTATQSSYTVIFLLALLYKYLLFDYKSKAYVRLKKKGV